MHRTMKQDLKKIARELLSPSETFEGRKNLTPDVIEALTMLGSLGSLTKPKPPEKPAQKPAPVPAPVSAAPTVSIETVKEEYRSALNNPELLQALMQLNPANSRPSVAAAKTTTRFPSRAILKSR